MNRTLVFISIDAVLLTHTRAPSRLRLQVSGVQRGIRSGSDGLRRVCTLGRGKRFDERRKGIDECARRRPRARVRVQLRERGRQRGGPERGRERLRARVVRLQALREGREEDPDRAWGQRALQDRRIDGLR